MGSYSGSVELVNSQAVNGVTGAISISSTVYSWLNGKLNGQIKQTNTIVSCDCVLSCICCCVTPDAGGANQCFTNVVDTFAAAGGDACNTGGGPACAGNPSMCTACNANPTSRATHTCLNNASYTKWRGGGSPGSTTQVKSIGTVTCGCPVNTCTTIGGLCNWIAGFSGCATAPLEGC